MPFHSAPLTVIVTTGPSQFYRLSLLWWEVKMRLRCNHVSCVFRYQRLCARTNFCETWYLYNWSWANFNSVLHKSSQSLCVHTCFPIVARQPLQMKRWNICRTQLRIRLSCTTQTWVPLRGSWLKRLPFHVFVMDHPHAHKVEQSEYVMCSCLRTWGLYVPNYYLEQLFCQNIIREVNSTALSYDTDRMENRKYGTQTARWCHKPHNKNWVWQGRERRRRRWIHRQLGDLISLLLYFKVRKSKKRRNIYWRATWTGSYVCFCKAAFSACLRYLRPYCLIVCRRAFMIAPSFRY
jgi:hypothetical protein